MKNAEVAAMLEETADLMEIAGENPFKARAYRKAAETISALREPIEELVKKKQLHTIEGVGESIARDIAEFLQRGTTTRLEQLSKKYPTQLRTLLEIQGVGPRTVAMLYDKLKITTIDQLEEAAKSGKLTKLPGMGEQKVKNILEGIQLWRQHQGRIPLYIALEIAERIVNELKDLEEVEQILPAGSLRRWKETVGDLDILVATRKSQPIMEKFVNLPEVQKVLAHGPTKSSVMMDNNFQVDLRAVEPESFGSASQYFTGSKAHNIALRNLALKRGLTVNEYGVFREANGEKIAGETEESVYEAIGLIWIPPELREDRGEIEAAMNGSLPKLITIEDVRGETHSHTKWSDGFASVEEMAKAAMKMGYEYIAITDHSPPMGWGVKPEDFPKLIREIRMTSEKLSFPILAGIEVDIAPDGSLYMDEDILKQLDIVIASVHSAMKMDIDSMTRRILRAMENPLVHIIGHPTGRIINQRPPYEVRIDALIDKAQENGVALEINASPERLDLNDENAKAAKEAGIILSIGTDSHRPEHLAFIRFGVAIARRAWCEPQNILNTRSYSNLLDWLKHRRI
ncbi:MAG: DNA polymerase/3'-5' exonuclease PolX [Armatimonadetes bacterium]|nr:DNA polymerase/3'-5' exonuclease PolX [Armatimonadota bacterium]MDW8026923.1 DNA polymerase/3'-5' exonuclease PolX [Armatimonadota bacterium]